MGAEQSYRVIVARLVDKGDAYACDKPAKSTRSELMLCCWTRRRFISFKLFCTYFLRANKCCSKGQQKNVANRTVG